MTTHKQMKKSKLTLKKCRAIIKTELGESLLNLPCDKCNAIPVIIQPRWMKLVKQVAEQDSCGCWVFSILGMPTSRFKIFLSKKITLKGIKTHYNGVIKNKSFNSKYDKNNKNSN